MNSVVRSAIVDTRHRTGKLSVARAPGTCGELFQSMLDYEDFLINCPVNWWSQARIESDAGAGLHFADSLQFSKVGEALSLLAQMRDVSIHHRVRVTSTLPRGKGLASSTADISAALAAFCACEGVKLTPADFAQVVCMVEPSDCVHFPGIVRVNHLSGKLIESYQVPQRLRILIVDCGGEVDTTKFDRDQARSVYRKYENHVRNSLSLMREGLKLSHNAMISRAATESAKLSQNIHYKPQFYDLLNSTRAEGALGLNCAHSGSVLGVMFEDQPGMAERLHQAVDRSLGSDVEILGCYSVIGGGCHE